MKRPRAIRSLGVWIRITYSDAEMDCWGSYCPQKKLITIYEHCPENQLVATIHHELRHHIWHMGGRTQNEAFKAEEEEVNHQLDHGTGDLFSLNPKSRNIRWEE